MALLISGLLLWAVLVACLALALRFAARVPLRPAAATAGLVTGPGMAATVWAPALYLGLLAEFVLLPPLLIWLGLLKAREHGPRPVGAAAVGAVVPAAAIGLESRGFRAVWWTEQGRPRRARRDTTVVAVHLLSPDGRMLCSVQGRRRGPVFTTVTSVVDGQRSLATSTARPFPDERRVVQRFRERQPDRMVDHHADAVALCDAIGLRLTRLDEAGVVAFLDRGWAQMQELLAGRELRTALALWFAVLRFHSPASRPVAEQPEALARLQAWRDEQQVGAALRP
jgi:hypothetical protein